MNPGQQQTSRLLCVGDMHLGRVPSRLPRNLDRLNILPEQLSPAAAWRSTVETAIREGVDAVLLAGDVVEAEEDFYEAFSLLDAGLRELLDAGIHVIAVAGNHDVMVLPRLADSLPGFQLLGRDGEWEEILLQGKRGNSLHILGWSFPQRAVHESPLEKLPQLEAASATRIGLLHCDLDAGPSPYAPVRSSQLRQAPVDAWLLGHIHAPSQFSESRPMGYLGSIVGLDPSETGRHGPWLMELQPGEEIAMQQVCLAPLRWESISVDLSDLELAEDLPVLISKAVEEHRESIASELTATRLVGCRLRLVGEAPEGLNQVLDSASEGLQDFHYEREGVSFFLERIIDATRPRIDLLAMSKGQEPPALLARRLLILERPAEDPEKRGMIAAAKEDLRRLHAQPLWSALGRRSLSEDYLVDLLKRSGRSALRDLLAQQEVGK
ncbi:MAG: metallophosphoesterase family protein [Planctomycetota bacterium]|jgi:DNA repair exonuclease SbcCD nuclease subunit